MSRSYCDGSSSANSDSSKTARGRRSGADEHDVAAEVAPRAEAVERGDPSDAVGLGVLHAALRVASTSMVGT